MVRGLNPTQLRKAASLLTDAILGKVKFHEAVTFEFRGVKKVSGWDMKMTSLPSFSSEQERAFFSHLYTVLNEKNQLGHFQFISSYANEVSMGGGSIDEVFRLVLENMKMQNRYIKKHDFRGVDFEIHGDGIEVSCGGNRVAV